jgi:lipoprotein-anchoring transpeptidase ErfK/SrfK
MSWSNNGMMSILLLALGIGVAGVAPAYGAPSRTPTASLSLDAVNDANVVQTVGPKTKGAAVLRAQVLLDRARFSPGEIDAAFGSNLQKAIAAFQKANGLNPTGTVDGPMWQALNGDRAPVLVTYEIAHSDVAGPFMPIPQDMVEKSKLPALGYTSAAEALGEKFHASPALLRQLNPGKDLGRAGQKIVVPNIEAAAPVAKAAKIIVSKYDSTITAVDATGKSLAHFPASTGSEYDPLPIGTWKIMGIAKNPVFHYNPKLFWDANPQHTKARIPAGPNNPVGVVWIDLSKEHYGIHGTPEPSKIGKTQSHGCIRMTNWDATALAKIVSPGIPVILQDGPAPASAVPAPAAPASSVPADPPRMGSLLLPVAGITARQLTDTFHETRGGKRPHEALDIPAPRGTPVLAVEDGRIVKLFKSIPGGLTIYQFDPSERFAYYYAHLDSYAANVAEGKQLQRGDVIGYVGSTGNANPATPHLHFAIFELGPEKRWWKGTAINPYPLLTERRAGPI